GFDDECYRFGILKIAYELGCKVLGPTYLDDPIAARFRSMLVVESPSRELLEVARIPGRIGGLFGHPMLSLPQHKDSWLTGVVFRNGSHVHTYLRLFDRFDGSFVLSENAEAYACPFTGIGWLTDVVAGTIRETNLDVLRGLAAEMAG